MKGFLLTTSTLMLSAVSWAAGPAELDRARAVHQAAVEKAKAPITRIYLQELERLRDTYTRAAKLDAANRVQAEIAMIKQGKAPAASTPTGPTTRPPDPSWVEGRTWVSDAGTRWSFLKGGQGEKTFGAGTTTFTWRVLDTGFVEVTGRSGGPDSSLRVWIVRFNSNAEAVYGDTAASLKARMRSQ
jgi:hypothetical protein